MKRRKSLFAFSIFASVLMFTAACSKTPVYVLPTLAPTYTPTPAPEDNNGPTPTPAPDINNTKILDLNGEEFNQISNFSIRGSGSLSVKPIAYTGSYSFYLSNRGDAWNGVTLNFSDTSGKVYDVVGKEIHVAAFVYQETGETQDFSFSLSVKKPDGTTDTPESISVNSVPSGKWTLLEGDIPVYANVTSPTVSLVMSSSKDAFYFDDIRLTYDEASTVAINKEYNMKTLDVLYFDFEDGESPLTQRGSASMSVVSNGADGSAKCLYVSERASTWNGVQIDLTEYGLAGSKIWISYSAKHLAEHDTTVMASVQYDKGNSDEVSYTNAVKPDPFSANEWFEASGSYTVPSTTTTLTLYFETTGTEDFYLDNVLISTKDPSTITIEKNEQGGGSVVVESPDKIDTTGFVNILTLSADGSGNEESMFSLRGSAKVSTTTKGRTNSGFSITGRTAAWNGVGLTFTGLDGTAYDVIGKQVYISAWVYQNSGSTLDLSATLQVIKADGTVTWPERATIASLPSGQWTRVEGLLPVYANIKSPQINFEIPTSDTADFILDDIVISYDPNSSVPANAEYDVVEEKHEFSKIELSFEDNNAFFQGRGNGKPSIVYGGHASNYCLAVTGRSSTWHGVQADLSEYDLAGKTLEVSYWVCHDSSTPFAIKLSAELNDGGDTYYRTIVPGDVIADGKWVQYTATYAVPATAKKFMVYFESDVADASFFIDDMTISVQ